MSLWKTISNKDYLFVKCPFSWNFWSAVSIISSYLVAADADSISLQFSGTKLLALLHALLLSSLFKLKYFCMNIE